MKMEVDRKGNAGSEQEKKGPTAGINVETINGNFNFHLHEGKHNFFFIYILIILGHFENTLTVVALRLRVCVLGFLRLWQCVFVDCIYRFFLF